MAEGEASLDEDEDEPESDAEAEGEADDSEDDSDFVLDEEDFFEGEAELSALAEVELFFVVEALVPVVPDFFVADEVEVEPEVVDFFFAVVDAVVLLAVVELAVVSFLFAHAVTNASAARTVIQHRTVLFIGVKMSTLRNSPAQGKHFNRSA